MNDERKDRQTTREEEDKLQKDEKDKKGPKNEIKEDIPVDDPPTGEQKKDFRRARETQKQKTDKE